MANFIERDERCVFVGNLEPRVTEEIIWELFLQAGPLEAVHIPKDKDTGAPRRFGFVSFTNEVSVPYAVTLMDGISLYGRAISVKPAGQGTSSPGGRSPTSNWYSPGDAPLRRSPMYDGFSGRVNPQFTPFLGLLTPPLMRLNYQQSFSPPRSPWGNGSPWLPNGERHLSRTPSSSFQPHPMLGSHQCQMPHRGQRPHTHE